MRVLHAATECFPYVKVGGLGDVMGSLPAALRSEGVDARLLLPGYRGVVQALPGGEVVRGYADLLGGGPAQVRRVQGDRGVPLYLLECGFFDRPGGPYEDPGDSHLRFAAFSRVAADLARQEDWRPDILHVHDWQAALAVAHLAGELGDRPGTVLTVHNLAYQGIFDAEQLAPMGVSQDLFHMHGVECHGRINCLKGGLQLADRITTVSPTYAREIQAPAFGEGLEELLRHRAGALTGILNGIDRQVWDPARDPHLPAHFSVHRPSGRKICKNHLQREMGLDEAPERPLFGVVSRFTSQKGLDLVLENVGHLVGAGAQLAVLGSGDPVLEAGFQAAAASFPGQVALGRGYDEPLSRRIMAGADVILVPSRFEPCGLTQMYAMAYGALPLVRFTGGLADSVVDAAHPDGTGFHFGEANGWVLGEALNRVLRCWHQEPRLWKAMQGRGMRLDQGWARSARAYLDVYAQLVGERR